MKLHETRSVTSSKQSIAVALLHELNKLNPKIKMKDISWMAAFYLARGASSYSTKDMAHIFYAGLPSLEDNQDETEDILYNMLESFIDWEEIETPEQEARAFNQLVPYARDFFNI